MNLTDLIRQHQANSEHDERYKNFDPENYDYTVKVRYQDGREQFLRNPKEEDGQLIDKEHDVPDDTEIIAVGTAFWNWRKGAMDTVGIDVDTDHNHAGGLESNAFQEVSEKLALIPWLDIKTSTGGEGLHAFPKFTQPVPVTSRAECSALARAVLVLMERHTKFDFNKARDCAGSNFWIYKEDAAPNAYQTVQAHSEELSPEELPAGWIDAKTASNRRIDYSPSTVELEPEHLKIEKEIAEQGYTIIWVDEYKCYHIHTKSLEQAAEKHKYRGIFKTVSDGTDPGSPNGYMFPLPDGGFFVKRFGDANEHGTWFDGANGPYAYLNVEVPIQKSAEHFSRADSPEGYVLSAENLVDCLKAAGIEFEYPEALRNRDIYMKVMTKELRFSTEKIQSDKPIDGWVAKKATWTKSLKLSRSSNPHKFADQIRVSNLVRAVSTDTESSKWCISTDGEWKASTPNEVRNVMFTELPYSDRITTTMGEMRKRPHLLIFEPFKPEYLPGRRWNHNAPQLACQPADNAGDTPTWDAVFDHIGKGLDDTMADCELCQELKITSGAHYLKLWTALLFRKPEQRTPYLFLTSRKNNTGKSSFGSAISRLIDPGVGEISAEALAGQFSGELEHKVLCLIEELDLRDKKKTAYTKLKKILTSKEVTVRRMRMDAYNIPNFTHFVHTANDARFVPCESEDTRIVMIDVPEIETPIESLQFDQGIRDEAPSMLRKLLDLPLPEPKGRFWLPVISTALKEDVLSGQYDDDSSEVVEGVKAFARERLVQKSGGLAISSAVYSAYQDFCADTDLGEEPRFPTVHRNGLLSLLKTHCNPSIRSKQKRIEGKIVYHYTDITLRN